MSELSASGGRGTKRKKTTTAEEFDRKFDAGEDVSEYLDYSQASRPNLDVQKVNVDFPRHFLDQLDRAAEIRGITRQSLIKTWLYERLEAERISLGQPLYAQVPPGTQTLPSANIERFAELLESTQRALDLAFGKQEQKKAER